MYALFGQVLHKAAKHDEFERVERSNSILSRRF